MRGIFLKGGIFVMNFIRKHKKMISRMVFITRISIRYYDEIESSINFLIGLIYKRSNNGTIQLYSI